MLVCGGELGFILNKINRVAQQAHFLCRFPKPLLLLVVAYPHNMHQLSSSPKL